MREKTHEHKVEQKKSSSPAADSADKELEVADGLSIAPPSLQLKENEEEKSEESSLELSSQELQFKIDDNTSTTQLAEFNSVMRAPATPIVQKQENNDFEEEGKEHISQAYMSAAAAEDQPEDGEKRGNANSPAFQMKKEPIQRKKETNSPETPSYKPNNTGLPDNLKSGMENLSGYSLDDVKVHYNSSQPAQLKAHAYAQGTDIHIGPGQEKHLPHEAWHVVQQKQGRVKPTLQMKGNVNVNDDAGLEKEADVMGAKALQLKTKQASSNFSGLSGKLVTQLQGHTDEWNNYTRADDHRVNNQTLPAAEGQLVNPKIQQNIRDAADRYKDVYISFGGNPIVISSPKAMFHFSLDTTDAGASGSHFTFETYNAGKWLNTHDDSPWGSEAVASVVNSPADNDQWLLERTGDRGMLDRLSTSLENHYFGARYSNLSDAQVDTKIASILADRATMTALSDNHDGADFNPLHGNNSVPKKKKTDAHWRKSPADHVLEDGENIQNVWDAMKVRIQARADIDQLVRDDIVSQTDFILYLGLKIYKALSTADWSGAGSALTDFGESTGNRLEQAGHTLDTTENANRLVDDEDQAQAVNIATQANVPLNW